ncbi:hypothetical protein NKDENANG_03278 [Candidatus Entotheonellaceae bacterium PAL068K]
MAEAKMLTFSMRNGEQRIYKDVTRIDDSRPHLVLVYQDDALIAQLNKHDVVTYAFTQPAQATEENSQEDEPTAKTPTES